MTARYDSENFLEKEAAVDAGAPEAAVEFTERSGEYALETANDAAKASAESAIARIGSLEERLEGIAKGAEGEKEGTFSEKAFGVLAKAKAVFSEMAKNARENLSIIGLVLKAQEVGIDVRNTAHDIAEMKASIEKPRTAQDQSGDRGERTGDELARHEQKLTELRALLVVHKEKYRTIEETVFSKTGRNLDQLMEEGF